MVRRMVHCVVNRMVNCMVHSAVHLVDDLAQPRGTLRFSAQARITIHPTPQALLGAMNHAAVLAGEQEGGETEVGSRRALLLTTDNLPLTTHPSPLSTHHSPLTLSHLPPIPYTLPLTAYHLLPTAHYALPTTHYVEVVTAYHLTPRRSSRRGCARACTAVWSLAKARA